MSNGAFSAALSGLNANSAYLGVIGNNLANINTVGYKGSSVSFMDMVSQTIGTSGQNPAQIGLGVATGAITSTFSQGTIEGTRNTKNAAIQGNGFFVVKGPTGNSYTRAGDFDLDKSGRLVTPDGLPVQGYTTRDANGKIVTTGQPGDITIDLGVMRAPVATTKFATNTNLNGAAVAGDTFSASVPVIDSVGDQHVATITYTKSATAGQWNYAITVPGDDVTGGTAGTPFSLGTGSVAFTNGVLTSVNGAAASDVAITTPAWKNGATASSLNWDLVDAAGAPTMTGFAEQSATSSTTQDGAAPGMLGDINIASDGTITAKVGTGQTLAIGQLALANFNNPKGLVKLGGSRYGETQEAGTASIGVAGTGGRGTLIGSSLEQSNVDIAQEFTQMILAQRGYQANSKSISVADELLVDTLDLKR
jgi:flagellar hook protein FlgE